MVEGDTATSMSSCGPIGVADEAHRHWLRQGRHERPKTTQTHEWYVREPEAEEDHVVSPSGSHSKISPDEEDPCAVHPVRDDADHLRCGHGGDVVAWRRSCPSTSEYRRRVSAAPDSGRPEGIGERRTTSATAKGERVVVRRAISRGRGGTAKRDRFCSRSFDSAAGLTAAILAARAEPAKPPRSLMWYEFRQFRCPPSTSIR